MAMAAGCFCLALCGCSSQSKNGGGIFSTAVTVTSSNYLEYFQMSSSGGISQSGSGYTIPVSFTLRDQTYKVTSVVQAVYDVSFHITYLIGSWDTTSQAVFHIYPGETTESEEFVVNDQNAVLATKVSATNLHLSSIFGIIDKK
jgi:hypothetical protein